MDQFLYEKIAYLNDERGRLDKLASETEDLMISGLIQQEIKRNEGLLEIYEAILDQYGWSPE